MRKTVEKLTYNYTTPVPIWQHDAAARVRKQVMYTMNVLGTELQIKVKTGKTYCCIAFNHPVRQFCIKYIVLNKYFDFFMIFIILVNSIIIVLNDEYPIAESVPCNHD